MKRIQHLLNILFIVFFSIPSLCYSQISLTGYVKNTEGIGISGVAIVVDSSKIVTVTDNTGKYTFSLGSLKSLCFSMLGYKDTCIQLDGRTYSELNIVLKENRITSDEALIIARKRDNLLLTTQTGLFELKMDSLKRLPNILGEADPIKMLQLTPGVTTNETAMGINVRGGSVDQNLVLLDDAIIYNPTHLMGIQSVFNPQILNNVTLIKSGIPAYYGGRLSAITEVETQKTIPDQTSISGNVGLLLSDLTLKIPILNHTLGIFIAGRSSYLDYTVKPLSRLLFKTDRSLFNNTKYSFSDFNFGIVYAPTHNDRIYISSFLGYDNFVLFKSSFNLDIGMDWQNNTVSSKWIHTVNADYLFKTSIAYTYSDFSFLMGQSDFSFSLNSKIKDISVVHEHSFYIKKSNFKIGIQALNQRVEPNNSKAKLNDLSANFGTPNNFNTYTLSCYIHSDILINQNTQVMLGMRANEYFHVGPFFKFIRQYNQDITDTVFFRKNELVQTYKNLEPRFALRYNLNERSSVKISATRNVQYLQQVNVSAVSLPTDFWMPANEYLPPLVGWQYSAGYYLTYMHNFEGSVESFYKSMNHIAEFNKGILSTSTKASMEENLLLGRGYAYGIEFMIRKNSGKLTGWISYTLSRSERIFASINSGMPFPAKYDRTHDLSAVAQYPINDKWQGSAVFVFASGNALTLPTGRYIVGGNILNQYSDYNAYRMPAYHRLDIAFSRTIKKTGKLEQKLNISIYNVYSRLNPFFMYFGVSGNLETYKLKVEPKMVSIFPMIPSVSYEFKF